MVQRKPVCIICSMTIGMMLVVTAIPVKTDADPINWWRQMTPADFNSDLMTNTHLYSPNQNVAFVHLDDYESGTCSFDYIPIGGQAEQIWEQGGQNPQTVGAFSQSFVPQIDGVVDSVDMRIWRVGAPIDALGNPATLTIKITDAEQSGIYAPDLSNVKVQTTFYCASVPTQLQLNSFRLTDTDSHDSSPLSAGVVYALYVTSTAVHSVNATDCFRWDITANPPHDTDGTYGCTKQYDLNGNVQWIQTANGQGAYDHPFKVYVHNFQHAGDIVSTVHDCGATSTFTDTLLDYTDEGTVTMYARTGPNSNPPTGWSDWVDEGTGSQNPGLTRDRYVQFKVEFVAGTDNLTTPGVRVVSIGYNTP